MNKTLFLSIGAAGVGSVGIGGFFLVKSFTESKEVNTFAQKYKSALLDLRDNSSDSSLWNAKFESLKRKQPIHKKLKESVNKSDSSPEAAKELHKRGCSEIYSSSIENSSYFNDFKNYCSKTVKEGASGNWITSEKTVTSDWNPKLTALKNKGDTHNSSLHQDFLSLKKELTSDTFNEEQREKLRMLCETIGSELLESNSLKIKNAQSFCVK